MLEVAHVVASESPAGQYRKVILKAPRIAEIAAPGQFLMVRCAGSAAPLLRRPLSINDVEKGDGLVHLLFRVTGEGTSLLAELSPGDPLDLMGPLGRGFELTAPEVTDGVILVGGGIGIAPLIFLGRRALDEGRPVTAVVGARSSEDVLEIGKLQQLGIPVSVTTEDGSTGEQGLVTEPLRRCLGSGGAVYACGPAGMLRAVALAAIQAGALCQVALEQRMACGVGVCQGCTCQTCLGDGLRLVTPGEAKYLRVCRDGPAFWVRGEEAGA